MTEQVQRDFQGSEAVPVYRGVANTIGERILRGEWPIGSGLPSETALAQTLGVNRSTMREAIRVLEENGMLRRPGGKRLFVSAPRDAEVAKRMKAAMVLQEMSFLELWEAMHCIEPAITAAAAPTFPTPSSIFWGRMSIARAMRRPIRKIWSRSTLNFMSSLPAPRAPACCNCVANRSGNSSIHRFCGWS